MLIAVDGIYGAGKSTLIQQLSNTYNFKVVPWNSCKEIHSYFSTMRKQGELDDPLVYYMMLLNDFAFTYEKVVLPLTQNGFDIVMDRYIISLAVRGEMRGLPLDYCINSFSFAQQPDISIVLDTSVDTAIARRGIPDQSVWKIGFKACSNQYSSYFDYLSDMRYKYLSYAKEGKSVVLNTDNMSCQDVFCHVSNLLK